MSNYEYKTNSQVNYGWGLTLNLTGKSPAISKRIFETKNNMENFVSNDNDTAIPGLILSVFNDTDNNGVYFVANTGSSNLKKLAFLSELTLLQSTLQTMIDSVQTNVDVAHSRIDSVQDNLDNVQTNVSFLQSNLNGLQYDVTGLHSSLETIQLNLSTAQDDISSLQLNLSTAQDDISSLQSNLSTSQNDISSLQDDLYTSQNDISSLQENLNTSQNDISSLQENLNTAQSDISSLQDDVSSLQEDLSTAQDNIDSLQSTLASQQYQNSNSVLENQITVTKDIGGYIKNTVIPAGTSIESILKNLLSPYVAFNYSASASDAIGTFEFGTTKIISTITITITQGTELPTILKIGNYLNSDDIQNVDYPTSGSITLNEPIELDGLSNKTIYLCMTDNITNINKTLTYLFVKHIYYGAVSSNIAPAIHTGLSHNSSVENGVNISANSGDYIVFLSPTQKTKIQQQALGQWNDIQTTSTTVMFTTSTGQELNYYCYFSPQQGVASNEKYKLI